MEIKFAVEAIDPEKATTWLEDNTSNRPIVQSHVDYLASMMKGNEWLVTHQGIAFSDKGRLLDGQHRLWAVVESGCTVQMMVSRGLDEQSFKYLDIGKKRSTGDSLGINRKVADVVGLVARMLFSSSYTIRQAEGIAKFITPHAEKLVTEHPTLRRTFSSAPVKTAAVARVLSGVPFAVVAQMYGVLLAQDYDKMTTAMKSFNQQVVTKNSGETGTAYSLLCRAWLAFDPVGNKRLQLRDSNAILDQIKQIFIASFNR